MANPFLKSSTSLQMPHEFKESLEPEEEEQKITLSKGQIIYRIFAAVYLSFVLFMAWELRPGSAFWSGPKQSDRIPYSLAQTHGGIQDFFSHYEGRQECGISSKEIYVPLRTDGDRSGKNAYCPNRATVMEAMSGGCHYRWYTTEEICMILERFDAIVFIGDKTLQNIYAAFNILLRENMALGALKQWEMSEADMRTCRCDSQFVNPDCFKAFVTSSEDVIRNDGNTPHMSPYYCGRTPHTFIRISNSPATEADHRTFNNLVVRDSDAYKPIPIIHSFSLAAELQWPVATKSMDEWIALADATERNTPYLWVGPTAAGHLKPPGKIMREGNNALWHYTVEMAKAAKAKDVETLGLYNMTMQAHSWDGSYYGEKVSLVQAMMVINWLSRVEST